MRFGFAPRHATSRQNTSKNVPAPGSQGKRKRRPKRRHSHGYIQSNSRPRSDRRRSSHCRPSRARVSGACRPPASLAMVGASKASTVPPSFKQTCAPAENGALEESTRKAATSGLRASIWKSTRRVCWFTRQLDRGSEIYRPLGALSGEERHAREAPSLRPRCLSRTRQELQRLAENARLARSLPGARPNLRRSQTRASQLTSGHRLVIPAGRESQLDAPVPGSSLR